MLPTILLLASLASPADNVYNGGLHGDEPACTDTANVFLTLWYASGLRMKHCAETAGHRCAEEYTEYRAIDRTLPAKGGVMDTQCPYLSWWVRTSAGARPDVPSKY